MITFLVQLNKMWKIKFENIDWDTDNYPLESDHTIETMKKVAEALGAKEVIDFPSNESNHLWVYIQQERKKKK